MHTITVHAHVLSLAEQHGIVPPHHWCHHLSDGSLTYRFGSSPNTYTWDAEAIAFMASTIDDQKLSAEATQLLSRWRSACALLERAGRPDPDRVLVDHDRDEMVLRWDTDKLVLVIGDDDAAGERTG